MTSFSPEVMYQALVRRDSQYDGIFYAAITTTGIFCRPTCRARKPKPEHVLYYQTPTEALSAGFRPCKVCQPLTANQSAPAYIQTILKDLEQAQTWRYPDGLLRKNGFSPYQVKHWFVKNYGMTFQAYLRSRRIGAAFFDLQSGHSVTHTAYNYAYESLSGFQDQFKKLTGMSPSHSNHKAIVTIKRMQTPLGAMLAGFTPQGLCILEFMDRKMLKTQLSSITKHLKAVILPGDDERFALLETELSHYFQGNNPVFKTVLHLVGTEFQQKVWRQLLTIPPGVTRSYKAQAQAIGQPEAVRAVAAANGQNRISILIPCHRVIGSDGKLVGYGGGLPRKKFLLELEQRLQKAT